MRFLLATLTATLFSMNMAAGAGAQVPVNENSHIINQLLAGFIGDKIRRTCPSISARWLVVLRKKSELEDYARAQGYDEDEVKAFLRSDAEKAKMDKRRDDYLASHGVVPGDVESYCALGRAEIASNSPIGQLLWSR